MTIESLKHFLIVAQGNTFLNAAEECNISQSSLSKSIQRLEHELGVKLFDRRLRSAKLTPAGECLLNDLQKMVPLYQKTMSDIRAFSELRRISCCSIPIISGFNSLLSQFMKNNPNISVESRRVRDYRLALTQLRKNELDFVFLHQPLSRQDQCSFTIIFDDYMYAIMPLNHPLASKQVIRFSDLMGQPLALDDYICPNVRDAAEIMGLDPEIQLTSLIREENILSIAAGNGVSLYYQSDIHAFKLDKVAVCLVEDFPHQPFVLAYSKRKKMSIEHLIFKESMILSYSELSGKEYRYGTQFEKNPVVSSQTPANPGSKSLPF